MARRRQVSGVLSRTSWLWWEARSVSVQVALGEKHWGTAAFDAPPPLH